MSTAVFQSIADRVGVSPRTVQRTLLGEQKDTRPTFVKRAETIRKLARELNYRPNAAAKATATGRFGCAALVMSAEDSGRSYLPPALLAGLNAELTRRDMHLTIAHLTDDKLTSEGHVPRILREWLADGLLINYNENVPAGMTDLLERYRLPAIWINVKLDSDCVFADDFTAARTLTETLLAQGRRKIAFVDYSHRRETESLDKPLHYSATDRLAGYEAAMASAGLTPRLIWRSPNLYKSFPIEFTTGWMRGDDRPDAVVCISPNAAERLFWIGRDLGIDMPRDVGLATFGNKPVHIGESPVTTAIEPSEKLGTAAVVALARRIDALDTAEPHVAVGYDFAFCGLGVRDSISQQGD